MDVSFARAKTDSLSRVPRINGQLIYVVDSGEHYLDTQTNRLPLGDIIDLDSEKQRQQITHPLTKCYFVKETGTLWRYSDGSWYKVSVGFDDFDNVDVIAFQSKTVTPTSDTQIIRPDNGYVGLSSVIISGDTTLMDGVGVYF